MSLGTQKQRPATDHRQSLARQLSHSPTEAAGFALFENTAPELLCEVLEELARHPRRYARYQPLPPGVLFWITLCLLMAISNTAWSLTNQALSLGMLVGLFVGTALLVALLHRVAFPQARALRHRALRQLAEHVPSLTPASLPLLLHLAPLFGAPEGFPTLQSTLVRLLPLLSLEQARSLSREQHEYILSLLRSSREELVIAALLALETIAAPDDQERIAAVPLRDSERIRAAKRECLETLRSKVP